MELVYAVMRVIGDQSGQGKNFRSTRNRKLKKPSRTTGKSKGICPTSWDRLCAKYPRKAMKANMQAYVAWVKSHDGKKIKRGKK